MDKSERKTVALEMQLPDGLSTKYATNMIIQHTEHEFMIFFF